MQESKVTYHEIKKWTPSSLPIAMTPLEIKNRNRPDKHQSIVEKLLKASVIIQSHNRKSTGNVIPLPRWAIFQLLANEINKVIKPVSGFDIKINYQVAELLACYGSGDTIDKYLERFTEHSGMDQLKFRLLIINYGKAVQEVINKFYTEHMPSGCAPNSFLKQWTKI